MSQKTNLETDDVKELVVALIGAVLESAVDGNSVAIQGFGTFEPREKARRKIYNPTTKTYIDVASKKTLSYKMSAALKDRINVE